MSIGFFFTPKSKNELDDLIYLFEEQGFKFEMIKQGECLVGEWKFRGPEIFGYMWGYG